MLYKNCFIKLWKSEWVEQRICGEWYSLNGYSWNYKPIIKNHKYIALIGEVIPGRSWRSLGCTGGSTPIITLDLARFSIDLEMQRRNRGFQMKIKQDPLTGVILYELSNDEVSNISDTDEYLIALTEFVNSQAIETFRHTKEYRKMVGRKMNQLNGGSQ